MDFFSFCFCFFYIKKDNLYNNFTIILQQKLHFTVNFIGKIRVFSVLEKITVIKVIFYRNILNEIFLSNFFFFQNLRPAWQTGITAKTKGIL